MLDSECFDNFQSHLFTEFNGSEYPLTCCKGLKEFIDSEEILKNELERSDFKLEEERESLYIPCTGENSDGFLNSAGAYTKMRKFVEVLLGSIVIISLLIIACLVVSVFAGFLTMKKTWAPTARVSS